ncbi:MAG TPA: phospho-sugar mutase [Kofleriaceae bacterium]|nr:phospho-sugar mutase [Kofleriaceae bacterium]
MTNSVFAAAQAWHDQDPDAVTKAELAAVLAQAQSGDAAALRDLTERFTGQLEFGTAGLRGVLGAGPQRMNRVLVRKVSAGLAAYLVANVPNATSRGVVLGYDGRRNSLVFAHDTARVLAGAGFKVYVAHRPWPTPTTAWCVERFGAAAGVMVTASHNPPEYNGYKVYWGNGAQIIPPHDNGIAAAIDAIGRTDTLVMPEFATLERTSGSSERGHVEILDESVHAEYMAAVNALRVGAAPHRELVIAYTALHGVGAISVEAGLATAGFTHVHSEPSQRDPDGEFPTVAFPNPEEKGAMDRVLDLARKVTADLVLANDPDADRLCVAVPTSPGQFQLLSGDQVGALLADYLLQPGGGSQRMVATTVVSSQLLGFLAQAAGVAYRETLTGFKWIANAALEYEAATGGAFVMGYEEALGYSVGPLVRDKDGVSACVIFAELTAWNRAQGRTVLAHLEDIYRRVGLFVTEQVSLTMPGSEGLAAIAAMMKRVRGALPTQLGAYTVRETVDLAAASDAGLPPSNVLIFRLDGGHRVIMRPSGTEPKLKSYYEVRVVIGAGETIAAATARGRAELVALRDAHQALLKQQ